MDRIEDWIYAPANWWEFWKPDSGWIGGILLGSVNALFWVWWFA